MEWLIAVIAIVVGLPAAAWFAQDGLIFHPRPLAIEPRMPAATVPIEIVADDGVRLRGWLRPAASVPAPAVLYFGGNAEEVSGTLADPRWPSDRTIVAVNYRGYGSSEGKPSERVLVADALRIHAEMRHRPEVDAGCMFVFGRSLGSGVAVSLAAARPVCGVVLVSPFDSLVELGRHHFRWLPVSLLLRHRFELLGDASRLTMPLLSIVAQHDTIIPHARSAALHEAWGGPKTWVEIPGTDHNTLAVPDLFWQRIGEFLSDPALPR
ncbi:MAG TPA: alpha/beta hydrolase [Burkholderiaceae bacterium]|mgnify:CR=1 FL=1|nr:alpha/beta hydrolase [Burkholderiaceae bacterium]